ncbi:class II aldolase/adducin family protein [Enemella sp. A6]|uniref:class II aldolase/adducin family protein n=1 Tax=Enemella sp. A6 TaxID=3440152 RepID=UPI003EBDF88C
MTETLHNATAQGGDGAAAPDPFNPREVLKRPTFATHEEERAYRKLRLAAGFRVLAQFGLTTGIAGHITVRDPEDPEAFWVNPLSKAFRLMKVSDLICVDQHGNVLEGNQPVNRAAFAIHSRIHHHNPEVQAACHSHSPWGRPWAATGRLIEPTSQDACAFYEAQQLVGGFDGVVTGLEVADKLGEAFARESRSAGGVTVVVHENHGHLTAGHSVDEAVFWFVLFDQVCQSQMRLEATGRPYRVLNDAEAMDTNALTATHYAGWLGFQSLYEDVMANSPDIQD